MVININVINNTGVAVSSYITIQYSDSTATKSALLTICVQLSLYSIVVSTVYAEEFTANDGNNYAIRSPSYQLNFDKGSAISSLRMNTSRYVR